jgi:predicted nucleotidyltransferase
MTTKENILYTIKAHKSEFLKFGGSSIGLLGSYLRNEQTVTSDIDLLIDFEPEKERFDNYMAVYDMVESLLKMKKLK